jgi:hypothetical protein
MNADDLLRGAPKLGSEILPLGRDSGRTGIDVALPGHVTAHGDQGSGAEAIALRPQQGRDHHVPAGLQSSIGADLDPMTQSVPHQRGLSLGQAQLPG